ncbi:MAG: hypothetical protein JOZ54_00755 [Acidobacteria bacterium]|nr:hypothetical protein [Acidobacteriota bacterium]
MRLTKLVPVLLALSLAALPLFAADVIVGDIPSSAEFAYVPGTKTVIDLSRPATANGTLTDATVRWRGQNGPCTDAFKVRFFRAASLTSYTLIAERGPFSTGTSELTNVTLSPGVAVQKGDVMALTMLGPQSCGGIIGSYGAPTDLAVIVTGDFAGGNLPATSLDRGSRYAFRAASSSRVLGGIIPVVGSVQGGFGSQFRTNVQVNNTGGLPLQHLTFVFHPQGQSASASDPSFTLPMASGTSNSGDLLATMNTTGVGSLDVMTTGEYVPQVIAHVFNDAGAAGTSGFLERMIPVRAALQPGEVADIAIPADLQNFRMNVGVRSLDAGAVIFMRVTDANGASSNSTMLNYAPNFFQQVSLAQFVAPVTSNVPAGGRVTLQVTNTGGPAIIYASTTDNRTNDSAIDILTVRP